jgi:ADP-ribosyl-[dinitrogen reductase] hydrolase
MTGSDAQAREDQFLGALLGLAIGDALGRPLRGMSSDEIAQQYGVVESYIATDKVEGDDARPQQGEISDKSEIALCLVESLTTNDGLIDPVNINARLTFLVAGPSSEWMSEATIRGIELAADNDGLVPDDYLPEPELAVAVRGVPVGLLHAVGGFSETTLEAEAGVASRLSHAGANQTRLTAEVAKVINSAGRYRLVPELEAHSESFPQLNELREIMGSIRTSETFASSVSTVIGRGGITDSTGAIAGAVAGARFGASGIPQDLIDGLDARIYLTLAAPWFYRAAVRRAGTVIDLRLVK